MTICQRNVRKSLEKTQRRVDFGAKFPPIGFMLNLELKAKRGTQLRKSISHKRVETIQHYP